MQVAGGNSNCQTGVLAYLSLGIHGRGRNSKGGLVDAQGSGWTVILCMNGTVQRDIVSDATSRVFRGAHGKIGSAPQIADAAAPGSISRALQISSDSQPIQVGAS